MRSICSSCSSSSSSSSSRRRISSSSSSKLALFHITSIIMYYYYLLLYNVCYCLLENDAFFHHSDKVRVVHKCMFAFSGLGRG